MAYNTWKGDAALGDVVNQDDIDTLIDWDENTITLKTNNAARLVVDNSSVSGSGDLEFAGNTFLGGTLNVTGNADFDGTVTCDTSLTIDSTTISAAEIGVLDGVSAGTAAASKAVVLDGSKNIATIGTIGCGAITSTGNSSYGTLTGGAISGSGTLQSVGNTFLGGTLNVTGAVLAGANVTLGDAGTDVITVSGRLTGSQGAYFNSRVGIGTATPSDELHISASTSAVIIESYESSIAQIIFKQAGENYGRIQVGGGGVFNIENLAENEDLVFKVNDADTTRTALTLDASVSEVIVNNGSDSLVDFRVESDSNTHMLFVDGGLNTVGINNSAPTHELTIGGNVSGSGTLEMVGNAFLGGTLNVTGNADFDGTVTCDTSLTIDSTTISAAEIGVLDGVSAGTAAASKAVVLDGSKNIATIGTVGCGAITSTGNSSYGTLTGGAISSSATLQAVGGTTLGATLNVSGTTTLAGNLTATAISGSGTLQMVGNAFLGGTLNVTGNADFDGTVTCDTSLTIDSTTISAAEIGVLDGVSGGTAAASKAVVLDGSKNIATIGTIGCGAITSTGNSSYGTLTGGAISGSGTLQAVGATTLGATLNVSGAATLAANLDATAISGSGTLQMVGGTTLGQSLHVSGALGAIASIGLGTTAVHASAVRQLSIADGTQPSFATANQISIGSKQSTGLASDGATLTLQTECLAQNTALDAVGTLSHRITIWHNGTEYYLYLDPV